ncbi:MAG: hypothetical protein RMJ98_07430 [Myxococcales bacterium]|nr:hypothetical protein [Polyangiaceae bacterium]MDW8249116.1 hypothetical protein [Myxococcales bacterium]
MSHPGPYFLWIPRLTARGFLCACFTLSVPLLLLGPGPTAHAANVSPKDKKRAAALFKEGEALFQKHAYAEAAQAFEEANSVAPHPSVLLNAIHAWSLAGQPARAAVLCQKLITDPEADDQSKEEARSRLAELRGKIGTLNIRGTQVKKLTLDGKTIEAGEVIVDPGDHLIEADVEGKPVRRKVSVVAGSSQQILLDAPKEEAPKSPVTMSAPAPTVGEIQVEPKKGFSPVVVYVGGVLTAGLLGVTVWSGLDTVKAREDFDKKAVKTEADKQAGLAKQTRTNVLIGATAVMGLLTTGVALFATNWSGTKKKGGAWLRVGPGSFLVEGEF